MPRAEEARALASKELPMRFIRFPLLVLLALSFAPPCRADAAVSGYTAHFTHLHTVADAHRIVRDSSRRAQKISPA